VARCDAGLHFLLVLDGCSVGLTPERGGAGRRKRAALRTGSGARSLGCAAAQPLWCLPRLPADARRPVALAAEDEKGGAGKGSVGGRCERRRGHGGERVARDQRGDRAGGPRGHLDTIQ